MENQFGIAKPERPLPIFYADTSELAVARWIYEIEMEEYRREYCREYWRAYKKGWRKTPKGKASRKREKRRAYARKKEDPVYMAKKRERDRKRFESMEARELKASQKKLRNSTVLAGIEEYLKALPVDVQNRLLWERWHAPGHRDRNEPMIVHLLRQAPRWDVQYNGYNGSILPDLTLLEDDKPVCYIEVKLPGVGLQATQEEAFKELNLPVHVVRDEDDVEALRGVYGSTKHCTCKGAPGAKKSRSAG